MSGKHSKRNTSQDEKASLSRYRFKIVGDGFTMSIDKTVQPEDVFESNWVSVQVSGAQHIAFLFGVVSPKFTEVVRCLQVEVTQNIVAQHLVDGRPFYHLLYRELAEEGVDATSPDAVSGIHFSEQAEYRMKRASFMHAAHVASDAELVFYWASPLVLREFFEAYAKTKNLPKPRDVKRAITDGCIVRCSKEQLMQLYLGAANILGIDTSKVTTLPEVGKQ